MHTVKKALLGSDPTTVVVPAYTLGYPGSTYLFEASVSSRGSTQSSSAFIEVRLTKRAGVCFPLTTCSLEENRSIGPKKDGPCIWLRALGLFLSLLQECHAQRLLIIIDCFRSESLCSIWVRVVLQPWILNGNPRRRAKQVMVGQGGLRASISGGKYRQHTAGKRSDVEHFREFIYTY